MSLARRLLTAGSGDGIIAPVDEVFAVTSAPNPAYTVVHDPKAYHHNGVTYIGWADGDTADPTIAAYNHPQRTLSSPFTLDTLTGVDTHSAVSVIVTPDGYIVAAYCKQNETTVRTRTSTNPEDATAFAAQVNATSGATYDYTTLVQLRGVANDPIYLFYRKNDVELCYVTSTDRGATWSAETVVVSNGALVYWRLVTDWDTRIDIFCTDTDPSATSSLFHFYIDGSAGTYHQSDGTAITSPPFTTAELTLVLDDTNGPCWSFGAAWDGAPASVIMQGVSAGDNAVKVARWRSGAWQVDTVLASVGGQFAGDKYYSGCGIAHTDPDTVYVAVKVGSVFEIRRYTSPDDGATWTPTTLTSSSAQDNVLPDVPAFAFTGLRAFWLYGSLTSSAVYDFAIRAIR